MQVASRVHLSARVGCGHHAPRVVQSADAHAVVRLLRTEVVQRREGQRHRVLVVAQVDLRRAGDGLFEYHLAVELLALVQVVAVHHHAHELRIDLIVHALVDGLHPGGIELYHVVEHLHGDGAVCQPHGLAVDERLGGNVVPLAVAVHVAHLIVLEHQAADAVARAHPDVVRVVLDDRVDHVIQQAVGLGIDRRQVVRLALVEVQSRRGAHPYPAA